ncbi:T-cell antigen CD7 isoform X2 [Cyclopterus lumpus]|uniref:T-cell antigen CD7 isoform X2 n=1 Tax=Cyclopterus lumpus TaxID=8103 RepID=UPI0014873BB7|nr:T-cell antigen CD7 isoform X2 [Cyclopterus lumpus]
MSAVYLKLITVLCVSCTGSSGVVWRDFGGDVTIQCRSSETDQQSLILTMGLCEELALFKDGRSNKSNIGKKFSGRLEFNGDFPNVDILIKKLTSNDTGTYWCTYTRFNQEFFRSENVPGRGSLLLVVTDTTHRCEPSKNHLILSVGICAAALLAIFLMWLILQAKLCTTKKPQRVATNDVYEDMRGTTRR